MFDPYKKWLGIPPKDQPPNHYRLLSLELYESDFDVIEGAADRVMGFLRQYQSGENAADAAKLLNEVAMARICLLKPATKADYDAKLRKQLAPPKITEPDEDDADEIALRTADLQMSDLPPRRKRPSSTKKAKSSRSSNPVWIPISFGTGVVILLVAFFLLTRSPRDVGSAVSTNSPLAVESSPNAAERGSKPAPPVKTVPPTEVTAVSTAAPGLPPTAVSPSTPTQPNPITPAGPAKKKKSRRMTSLDPSITHSDYLVEDGKTDAIKFCHSASIVETPKGLVAAFQAGNEPKASDTGIWVTFGLPGNKWTAPVEVASEALDRETDPLLDYCSSPVLFQYSPTELLLFYRVGQRAGNKRGVVKVSSNHGRTWSKPTLLPEGFVGPTRTKPYLIPDRSILCGSSTESDGWRVHFERLIDNSKWTKTPSVNDGKTALGIEPALLFHGNNRWQAIGRSATQHGKIFEVWSNDGAQTWGEMTFLEMPNPNSPIDAITLKDGRHVLVYNHSATERTPLNVAFSKDGKNWEAALTLEVDDHESSTPSVIQTADGMVHIAYGRYRKHIRHLIFDPQKVRLQPIIDGEWPMH